MLVTLLLAKLPQLAPVLAKIDPELGLQGELVLRQASQDATEVLLAGLESDGGLESGFPVSSWRMPRKRFGAR